MNYKFILSAFCAISLMACSSEGNGLNSEPKGDDDIENGTEPFDLNVISFNLRVDNPNDGDYVWGNRKSAVVAMINRESPDVIGMQEAQPHQITYLADRCSDYGWYGIGRDTGKKPATTDTYASEETAVIFYKKDKFEIEDRGTFWLSETPDTPSKGWDAGYNRTCSWVLLSNIATGGKFYFFNTHLDNSGKKAREESIKLIVAKIKAINSKELPVFLTADFNSDTSSKIFAPLHDFMDDAREEAPTTDNKPTYNGYKGTSKKKLDHIFCEDVEAIKSFKTLDGDYGIKYISDHYPVQARFVIE